MFDDKLRLREKGGGVEIDLHVQPRARSSEITGLHNGALKLRISAPPVDGAANRAVVEFFSVLLDLPKSKLCIVAGERSRQKTLYVKGLSAARLRERLALYSEPLAPERGSLLSVNLVAPSRS